MSSVLLAMAANQLGWIAAETGRQPWTVHPNVILDSAGEPVLDSDGFIRYQSEEGLRTNKAISESIGQGEVAFSILLFGLIYTLLLFVWIYVLNHKIQKGPEYGETGNPSGPKGLIATAAEVQATKSLMTPDQG